MAEKRRPGDIPRHRRGWRGWRKHLARWWRRLKPDDLVSFVGVWVFLAVGLVGMYFAGWIGIFAAVVLMALVAYVYGVAARAVKRIVGARSTRAKEP